MAFKSIDIACSSCDWFIDVLVERGPEEEQIWECPECGADAKKAIRTPVAARTRTSRTFLDGQRKLTDMKEAAELNIDIANARPAERAGMQKEMNRMLKVKK
jgi:ribosomal protein L37AE/L43A